MPPMPPMDSTTGGDMPPMPPMDTTTGGGDMPPPPPMEFNCETFARDMLFSAADSDHD